MECAKISTNCIGFFLDATTSLKSLSPWNFTTFKKRGTNLLVFSVSGNLYNGKESCFSNPPKWYKDYLELPPTQSSVSFLCCAEGLLGCLAVGS